MGCREGDVKDMHRPKVDSLSQLRKRADHLYSKGDYKFALLSYERLARLDSNDGENFFRKARCEAQFSLYDQSNKDFLKAIALDYRADAAYYNMGLNELAVEQDSLAIINFRNCLRVNPNHKSAKRFLEAYKVPSK
jgi:tetratricopeptide (TPR) repeat protein